MVAVHVLIDLDWEKAVGGHVKSWMQFAKVAQGMSSAGVDLTLHFQGDRHQEIPLSNHVRYVLHQPRFSTERLPFLQDVPSHTDLAANAPTLIPYLERSDLVHSTHPLFTFGKTAMRVCDRLGKPLVSSIHTNAPLYAKVYLEEKLRQMFGPSILAPLLLNTLRLTEKYKASQDAKQYRHWQTCQHVWYGQPSELAELQQFVPDVSCSKLRRGLDLEAFSPEKRDRQQLHHLYGIPPESFLLLFVGRLDVCKNFMTYARTLQVLRDRNLPVHGIVVGKGSQGAEIKALLGQTVSLLGALEQKKLGLIYASSDLFVFPSETEIFGNVILEAKASGLVPCISDQGGVTQHIEVSGQDGLIISGQNPKDWAEVIESLYESPAQLAHMGAAAFRHVQQTWPTWETVFKEDLLPVWQAIAQGSNPQKIFPKMIEG